MDDNLLETLELSCTNQKELPMVAKELFEFAGLIKVWLFVGDLGAGKTTLIKQICKHLGVVDEVTSPTFSIINEYLAEEKPVYHFDFYRLSNEKEVMAIGVGEYFYLGNYCFIEWPQKVEQILPDDLLLINITSREDGTRDIKVTKYD